MSKALKIKLPFSVFIKKSFVDKGTEVYVIPIKPEYLNNFSYTIRVFNIPRPTKCLVCLTEDDANFMQIKIPQVFI